MNDFAERAAAARAEIAVRWPGCNAGEVRDGWITLVRDALDQLGSDAHFVVRLICENGQLLFVNRGGTPSPASLAQIAGASKLARTTCEECGRQGARRVGRDEVLCAEHAPPPGVQATTFQIRVADARDEIARRWPHIDVEDLPDGWAELALRALDEIDAMSYVALPDGSRRRVESEADRVVRIDSDDAGLSFSQDAVHAVQVPKALDVFVRTREASEDLCEVCGEHGARRTGHDNRLCVAHAPDLRAWRRDLDAHAADTEETILAALDPDADELEEWTPRFRAIIPWSRERRTPLRIEAESPEALVEELIRVGVLHGRYSASMSPVESWQALRRLWEGLMPKIRERCVEHWQRSHPGARIEDLPRLPRRVFLHPGRPLPRIETWSEDWPPLPAVEGWWDWWWTQHEDVKAFPGPLINLHHGSASQFLTSLVKAAELREWGPVSST